MKLRLLTFTLYLLLCAGCGSPDDLPTTDNKILDIQILSSPEFLNASRTYNLEMRVTNISGQTFASDRIEKIKLSYHWSPREDRDIFQEGIRSSIASSLSPGESQACQFKITAPPKPGEYYLLPGAVEEDRAWLQVETKELKFKVLPWDKFSPQGDFFIQTGSRKLDKASKLALTVIDSNTWNSSGHFFFTAGATYQNPWIRDFFWSIPALKWLVEDHFLQKVLTDYLLHQREDGELPDWANDRLWLKNSVLSDHEANAVLAAHLLGQFSVSDSLAKRKTDHRAQLQKLHLALEWLWRNRLDKTSGMITTGHTADWGDVESEEPGTAGLTLGENSHPVVGIFHQAHAAQAAESLADMFNQAGEKNIEGLWRQRANELKTHARKLWSEKHGHYLIHKHTTRLDHLFPEENIFSLAGNTRAITAAIADPEKIMTVINKAAGLIPFGASLSPAYPDNFFKHSYMQKQNEYQNGGIWIWHASQMVLEEFRNGRSASAVKHLEYLAAMAIRNRDFHEWHLHNGQGMGSPSYTASAASFLNALIAGYFGVDLDRNALVISPRLRTENGRLRLSLPGQNKSLRFNYSYSAEKVEIITKGNLKKDFTLRWLKPEGFKVGQVELDGTTVNFEIEAVNLDEYLIIKKIPLKSAIIIKGK